ncbi:glycosyltransferase family 4 protein [Hortaea werneckii]|nr:glycosyltransferase family 4 protein [Hortaea werneckii]
MALWLEGRTTNFSPSSLDPVHLFMLAQTQHTSVLGFLVHAPCNSFDVFCRESVRQGCRLSRSGVLSPISHHCQNTELCAGKRLWIVWGHHFSISLLDVVRVGKYQCGGTNLGCNNRNARQGRLANCQRQTFRKRRNHLTGHTAGVDEVHSLECIAWLPVLCTVNDESIVLEAIFVDDDIGGTYRSLDIFDKLHVRQHHGRRQFASSFCNRLESVHVADAIDDRVYLPSEGFLTSAQSLIGAKILFPIWIEDRRARQDNVNVCVCQVASDLAPENGMIPKAPSNTFAVLQDHAVKTTQAVVCRLEDRRAVRRQFHGIDEEDARCQSTPARRVHLLAVPGLDEVTRSPHLFNVFVHSRISTLLFDLSLKKIVEDAMSFADSAKQCPLMVVCPLTRSLRQLDTPPGLSGQHPLSEKITEVVFSSHGVEIGRLDEKRTLGRCLEPHRLRAARVRHHESAKNRPPQHRCKVRSARTSRERLRNTREEPKTVEARSNSDRASFFNEEGLFKSPYLSSITLEGGKQGRRFPLPSMTLASMLASWACLYTQRTSYTGPNLRLCLNRSWNARTRKRNIRSRKSIRTERFGRLLVVHVGHTECRVFRQVLRQDRGPLHGGIGDAKRRRRPLLMDVSAAESSYATHLLRDPWSTRPSIVPAGCFPASKNAHVQNLLEHQQIFQAINSSHSRAEPMEPQGTAYHNSLGASERLCAWLSSEKGRSRVVTLAFLDGAIAKLLNHERSTNILWQREPGRINVQSQAQMCEHIRICVVTRSGAGGCQPVFDGKYGF